MTTDAPIVIVTGASRGAGRGIAIALGAHGCTANVTGRTKQEGEASLSGTIYATAEEVTNAGGTGIPVCCDSGDDDQVKQLFEQVINEQGRIDILVNNAAAIHDELVSPKNFWEKPVEIGNMIDVGVRSGYVASWLAAPQMIKQEKALIVFTSAPGSVHYCLGPAYGAHKAGMDKMAYDMAVDFKDAGTGVATVSIWMGGLMTERLLTLIASAPEKFKHLEDTLETPEFTGHVIWALYHDDNLMAVNGRTLIGAELGRQYNITDKNGKFPPSTRELSGSAPFEYYPHIVK